MKALAPEINRTTLPQYFHASLTQRYLKQSFTLRPAATGFSETGIKYRTGLFTVMAVVGLVLLIACANIANLLLARAAARKREISVRMAIGAGRGRVIRQLMTESLLLSFLGAGGGLLFAVWGSPLLVRLLSKTGNELQLDVAPDVRVLAFTIVVAILTGLLFGLAPALRATNILPNQMLKEHARGMVAGTSRLNLGKALVTGQVALSLMLLAGAALFLGTLRNLLNTDLGFSRHNVLLVGANVVQANVTKTQRSGVYREIVQRLSEIPGLASASSSEMTPISGGRLIDAVYPEGYSPKAQTEENIEFGAGKDITLVYFNRVSPGYFQTMRTHLLLGRDFSSHDVLSAPKVMIINESAAHRFFAPANPIGKIIGVDPAGKTGRSKDVYQVIGVVKDAKYVAVGEGPKLTAYVAHAQDADPPPYVNFEVRSDIPAGRLIPSIRSAIGRVNRGIALEFRSLETQVDDSLLQPRMVALLSGFFGGLALLLVMIGLYGVTAYGVARRQGEIGIRMALGAQQSHVLWMVLRETLLLVAIGVSVGIASAWAIMRLVSSMLFGVTPNDPPTIAAVTVLMLAVAVLAAYVPARKASRIDPMVALRYE